ncbi:MAG: hypothetical protein E4G89_00915 [Methanothrix sp.]|nr:MAG: hypothetical protein E4G89_00915 [Methanothrix sp.]
MQPITAVVEEAEVYKISQLFPKKPPGLAFNETDALVIKARMQDGRQVGATFYFCLKPDGTFEEEALGRDAVKARRHKLASFLRYYKLAEEVDKYNLKDRIHELKGRGVEVIPIRGELSIYTP